MIETIKEQKNKEGQPGVEVIRDALGVKLGWETVRELRLSGHL